MRKIDLLAVDLDGTLLNSEGGISPRVSAVLKKAAEAGVAILPATGRMYQNSLPTASLLHDAKFLICCQGAIAYNIRNSEILFKRAVPLESARRVVRFLKERGRYAQIYDPQGRYYERVCAESVFYDNATGPGGSAVGDLLSYMNFEPLKVLTFRDENDRSFEEECFKCFSDELSVTISSVELLEFTSREATKGLALKSVADSLGIPSERIMAAGDSYNDIPMIEYAGLGVAMGNAPDAVKERADIVALSNDEDGLADIIERYILC